MMYEQKIKIMEEVDISAKLPHPIISGGFIVPLQGYFIIEISDFQYEFSS